MTDPLLAKEGEQAATGMTFAEVWAQARALWQRFDDLLADRQVVASLLLIILALGAILRFTGLDWDNHQHLHPDERFLTMVENSLQWPKSLKEYFDTANNPLNPYNHGHGTYVYGLLPVVLAKALGELVGKTGYDGVYLVGRAMNSVLDLGSVLLVFLIGRRLYGVREGLMGALLLSMSVLNIQNAHFFTVDTSTTFFVTLALYFAVRVAQHFDGTQGHSRHMPLRSGWGSVLMLGVSFGLAVSAKISVLSFLLIIGLAYVLRVSSRWRAEDNAADDTWLNVSRRLGRLELSLRITPRRECGRPHPSERWLFWGLGAALSMLAVVLVAVLVFRVVQPQAFTGPGLLNFKLNPKWKDDMSYIQKLVSGEIDYPPSHQWTAREPIWYMLKNMVLWGLGLPLGLAVWGGWALMAYELYFKHKWAHLLPWVWMSFTFLYQSVQFVKTIRYLLPIYPTMAVIAGYGLVRLLEWARNRVRGPGAASSARWRWARVGAVAVVLLVVLGTAFWAFAFTRIYTRPVTRVAASRWIYANLPRGSTLSFELWDDPVPLNVDGHLASAEFKQIQMDLYWEDIPEKRERLYQALEELDYIILSSNRLYGSIPRLPMRYPLTTRYYEALFSGELGFERIKTFTSRPGLFGIEIVDDNADETFTVYDHPKVIIFKKRPDFSMEKVRAMLDVYDLERIVRVRPIQVTQAPNNLMLDEATWELQRRGGTWSELFDRNSLANKRPTLIWLLALYFVGLAATPLGFLAFRRLRDRGYILSKTLGILLLAYLPWLLASLRIVPYTRGAIWGCLLLIAAASGAVAWWQRRELGEFLRARWRLLAANELLFLGFFLLFWLIRLGNPDLWHPAMGGEKPMDLAYLNAIIKSSYFPPYDPWFAGGYINYYYFGWVTVASLIKLTGIVPTTAYNLAIPTYFSLLAMGACTVTFNLIPKGEEEAAATPWFPRALRFGLAGACLVAILGNLGEVELLLNGFKELGNEVAFKSSIPLLESLVRVGAGLWAFFLGGKKLPFRSEWWYWNASRIMDHGEINEFPFFSFLYADLHAHVTAMPFALLALALAVGLVLRPRAGMAQQGRPAEGEPSASIMRRIWARARELAARVDGALLVQLTLLGLTLGELWCNNSWDYPTYMGISLVALAIGLYHETRRIDQRSLTRLALQAGYLIALSMILFYPYHAHFGLGYSSVEPWKGERTSLGSYLLIHGPMLFILASYLLALAFRPDTRNGVARTLRLFWRSGDRRGRALELYERLVRCQTLGYEAAWGGLVLLGAVWLVLLLAKAWVLVVATPLAVLAIALTFYRRAQPAQRLQTFFVATGLLLTMAVEYIVLKGDIGRMNTVFKFYLQVWILWGVVGGAALAHLLPRTERWATMRARLWRTALALLLMGAGLYPILATWGKVRDRWNPLPPGLDGMAYMTKAQYHDNRPLTLEHDRRAIIWLQEHVVGSPVIVEANTPLYRWGNRVSIYTGLPAIIGWDWHQKQQRTAVSGVVVDWRLQDLNELYNTHDIVQATRLLDRYQVGLIYVGELEQAYYDPQGLAKFDDMVGSVLDVVYRQGPVTIYRVRGRCALIGEGETSGSRTALPTWWRRLRPSWIAGAVLAQGPEKRPSGDLIEAPPHEPLMLDVPVEEIASVDNRGWNGWGNVSTLGAVVSWWLILQLLGLATWPLLWAPFARFQDRGYGLAKGFGLLLASYLVWISSSLRLAANGPPMAWLAVVALGGGSFFLWRRRRRERDDLRALWQRSRRLLLLEEALFNASFLAFVGIRILNPDLWHPWFGGEKPMEIAYLNAITKSAYMPPYDPYFAGGYLNYYYFGQFIAGVLLKLTGIRPEVGFNLAVPTFFALTVAHTFALGYELARRAERRGPHDKGGTAMARWAGLAAVVFVAVMGNLSGALQMLERLARAGGAAFANATVSAQDVARLPLGLWRWVTRQASLPPFDYWYRATRVVPYTINEFPFFSFLFADLHPHMIAIPLTLLVVGLCLALILDQRQDLARLAARYLLLAVGIGALGVTNTWDLPTYWGLAACASLYRGHRLAGRRGLLAGGLGVLLLSLGSLLLYGPFYKHYQAQYVGITLVPPVERTTLAPFLVIWGFFLFVAVGTILYDLACSGRWRRLSRMAARWGWVRSWRRLRGLVGAKALWGPLGVLFLAGSLGGAALLAHRGDHVLALLLPLWIGAGVSALWGLGRPAQFLRRLMLFVALGILGGVEIIYMKDFLDGSEWRRMNTLFKFYIQAWVLLGLSLGSTMPGLWRHIGRGAGALRFIWRAGLAGLLAASLVYTVAAIPARVTERFPGVNPPLGTLDGTAYMYTGVYYWPDAEHPIELWYDRQALEWFWEHVPGTPVLAEAAIGFYREGGLRISSYTGLPTIVGAHEREQRPWDQVGPRERHAEAIYVTQDEAELLALLDRYRVRYIYIGQLERYLYDGPGLAKFEELARAGRLELVYHNEKTAVYRTAWR